MKVYTEFDPELTPIPVRMTGKPKTQQVYEANRRLRNYFAEGKKLTTREETGNKQQENSLKKSFSS